ncbi:MAG: hypothetical protein JXA01_05725 [Dehalococcoidia bacterium]|nr:hypothetical protein [Dehalococcoidia bacterium]
MSVDKFLHPDNIEVPAELAADILKKVALLESLFYMEVQALPLAASFSSTSSNHGTQPLT